MQKGAHLGIEAAAISSFFLHTEDSFHGHFFVVLLSGQAILAALHYCTLVAIVGHSSTKSLVFVSSSKTIRIIPAHILKSRRSGLRVRSSVAIEHAGLKKVELLTLVETFSFAPSSKSIGIPAPF